MSSLPVSIIVTDYILFSECCAYLRICMKYGQEMRGKHQEVGQESAQRIIKKKQEKLRDYVVIALLYILCQLSGNSMSCQKVSWDTVLHGSGFMRTKLSCKSAQNDFCLAHNGIIHVVANYWDCLQDVTWCWRRVGIINVTLPLISMFSCVLNHSFSSSQATIVCAS